MADRQDLLGVPLERLEDLLAPHLDRPFRARQIYHGVHRRGVEELEQLTDLPATLRAALAEHFTIGLPPVASRRTAADGTTKFLFQLADGATVEAVDIPDGKRTTFCISSQAGCPLGCRFCVTGYWGAGRSLTSGEIVGQVFQLRRHGVAQRAEQGELPAGLNLVFMGMGEPLLNLPAVKDAIHILAEEISWRRMTLSTVGLIPQLQQIAAWPRRPNLAISLHAPDDERRSRIMPINRTHPLEELLATLREFPLEKGRRITFEYILIRDFNDADADADALARQLRGLRAKVNLIPLNPDPVLGERMAPPLPGRSVAFRDRLNQRGVVATIRRQRGDEVSGACGQLRAAERAPRGFRTPVNL
jgi:23S rRNA (adenine2503-C2)-methyltransferase